MAQVNVQYPALNQLFGAHSVMPAYYGTQQLMAAQESEKINQEQALQDTLFRAQDQEYDLKTKQAGLDQSAAMLPGYQADSATKTRDNQVRQSIPIEQEMVLAARKSFNNLTAADIQAIDNEVSLDFKSGDAERIKRARALSMYSAEVVREQEKARALADREERKIKMQGDNALAVARVNAASREKTAGSGSAPKSEAELMAKADWRRAANYFKTKSENAAFEAEMMPDGPEKEMLLKQANNWLERANERAIMGEREQLLRGQQTQSGKVDMGAVSGMETIPAPQPRGFGGTNPGASTPVDPIAKAVRDAGQQYQPDVYNYRISPDGKVQRKAK